MGRKTNITIAPASGIGGTTAQSFQYNGVNQSTFARDTANGNNADVTLVYDSIQRTVEEEQVYGGNTRYVTNNAFASLAVSQFTFPNARQINSGYDALYRKQQVIEAATSAVIASWQFFGPQRIAEVALGNGIIQTMLNNARTHSAVQFGTVPNPPWGTPSTDRLGYDGSGRMIAKRYLAGGINSTTFAYNNTTPVVGNTTAFDPADNKFYERALHAEERSFLYQPVDNDGNIASPAPGYDSINRLLQYERGILSSTGGYQNNGGGSVTTAITLQNTDEDRTYNIDGMGNWRATVFTPLRGIALTDPRNHNYLNQITSRNGTAFFYDGVPGASNGNLAHTGGWNFFYDALNRLIQVKIASTGVVIAAYVYDALNRRARKTITNGGTTGNIPDGMTDYIYMGNQVVEERNPFGGSGSTDTPIRQYIWGTYIDECIQLTTLTTLGSQSLSPGTYYLLQDLLYRAVALANSSGAIVEAYDCDAYGNTLIFTGPGADGVWFTDDDVQSSYGANEIIYCGYRFDPESELYHVRNRTYSPVLGRWIQRDPIGYAGSVNLYEYASSRPATRLDPNGKKSEDCCSKNGNCCGADITLNLLLMAGDVRAGWSRLSLTAKLGLAFYTLDPITAFGAWDISGMAEGQAINNAPPCQSGTGKCNSTVTVSGKCYLQGAVNYWLAGLIYNALASSWETSAYASAFYWEVAANVIGRGIIPPPSPILQKWDWFVAGAQGNTAVVPPPNEFESCKPCKVRPGKPLIWQWGFLRGQD